MNACTNCRVKLEAPTILGLKLFVRHAKYLCQEGSALIDILVFLSPFALLTHGISAKNFRKRLLMIIVKFWLSYISYIQLNIYTICSGNMRLPTWLCLIS